MFYALLPSQEHPQQVLLVPYPYPYPYLSVAPTWEGRCFDDFCSSSISSLSSSGSASSASSSASSASSSAGNKKLLKPKRVGCGGSSDHFFPVRSASEARTSRVSSSSASSTEADFEFRRLPCRTFVATGRCPYRDHCCYLHDPRVECFNYKLTTRRRNKCDAVYDAFFWPPAEGISADSPPSSSRVEYSIPAPRAEDDAYFQAHDRGIYSLWMHFVDFCLVCQEIADDLPPGVDAARCYVARDTFLNQYTQQPRLPVFRALSAAQP